MPGPHTWQVRRASRPAAEPRSARAAYHRRSMTNTELPDHVASCRRHWGEQGAGYVRAGGVWLAEEVRKARRVAR